jgi:hypothetical protein
MDWLLLDTPVSEYDEQAGLREQMIKEGFIGEDGDV